MFFFQLKVLSAAIFLGTFLLHDHPAEAQATFDHEDSVLQTARSAFVHVLVRGDPVGEAAGTRVGKAFAIGGHELLTARHIVGKNAEWKPQPADIVPANLTLPAELAVRNRTVHLRSQAKIFSDSKVTVEDTLNLPDGLAAITVYAEPMRAGFRLGHCAVLTGSQYFALMADTRTPESDVSINTLHIVGLKAAPPEPGNYGALIPMDPIVGSMIARGKFEGHQGSPIFDVDGKVVAIVTAIVAEAGAERILATPIEPHHPGKSRLHQTYQGSPDSRCSLAHSVGLIRDQVSQHVNWRVEVEREPDGRPVDTIELINDSVSRGRNVAEITIKYEFWGTVEAGGSSTIIPHPSFDLNKVTFTGDDARKRTLRLAKIIEKGKNEVEEKLIEREEQENNRGSIYYVKLKIDTTLDSGVKIRNQRYHFPWRILSK